MLTFTTPFTALAAVIFTVWSAAATNPWGTVISLTVYVPSGSALLLPVPSAAMVTVSTGVLPL